MIDNNQIVVTRSDKSGELCVDSIENYEEAVKKHIGDDREIDWDRVKQIENELNKHYKQFNKMFSVGEDHNHELRVSQASTSTNCPPPSLDVMRKTHKKTEPGMETVGPPTRLVVAGNVAPNSRFGDSLANIIDSYSDIIDHEYECKSSGG